MIGFDRILCLANSYKHDHRCVAGLSLVTLRWVRLIGRQVPGCLTRREITYANGKEAALLDVFEAECGERCGSNAHPEDVFVTEKPWRFLRRLDDASCAKHLTQHINNGPTVFEGYSDSVSVESVMEVPRESSLELIQPDDLWWWVRDERGKRKNRALFRMSHDSRVRYDLAVTDPAWLDQLNLLPVGIYPHALLAGGKAPKTFLTLSLSEPYNGFHYKLVAGVIFLAA